MSISGSMAETLLQTAAQAAAQAYAPYSHFPVGAALLCTDGEIITGVNVENASYGLTICAERTAVAKAITAGKRHFVAIAVWASSRPHGSVTPCGACRQFLAEFFAADGTVIASNIQDGSARLFTMKELLPEAFGPAVVPVDSYPGTDSSKPGG